MSQEIVGMTDSQYKGMLLDQIWDWREVLELAKRTENVEIQKLAEKKLDKLQFKLKL